jgi:hypothetical protein
MDRTKLFEVLDVLELPQDSYIVVGGAVFLPLPNSWRTTTADLDLVINRRAELIIRNWGWEQVPGAVGAPILVGEVAGVKVEAGRNWGTPLRSNAWTFGRIASTAIEVEGYRFAHPQKVIEWKLWRGPERTDPTGLAKDAADIAAWGNYDPKNLRQFLLEHPTPELEDIVDQVVATAHLLLRIPNQDQALRDYALSGLRNIAVTTYGRNLLLTHGLTKQELTMLLGQQPPESTEGRLGRRVGPELRPGPPTPEPPFGGGSGRTLGVL